MLDRLNLKNNNQANNSDRGYVSALSTVSLPEGVETIKEVAEMRVPWKVPPTDPLDKRTVSFISQRINVEVFQ